MQRFLRGDFPSLDEVRSFGEDCPDEFFRSVVEPLADSFDLATALLRISVSCAPGFPTLLIIGFP